MQVPLDEITGRDVQHPATGALQGNIIRRPSCKHFRVLLFFFGGGVLLYFMLVTKSL